MGRLSTKSKLGVSKADYNLKARYVRALKKTPKNKRLLKEIKGDVIHNQIAALDNAWRKQ